MPKKSVKIDICGTLTEVDNLFEDEEYRRMNSHDYCSLNVPMTWEHKKYRLTMVCKGLFEEDDTLNLTASCLHHHLWSTKGHSENVMMDTVWIMNEDSEDTIDMTIEDMRYILEKTQILMKKNKLKER